MTNRLTGKYDTLNSLLTAIPEPDTLSTILESAISEGGVLSGKLEVLSRKPNKYYSTFPSEIVTCRIGNEREIMLFCKYSDDLDHEAHGHRGGVEYEADVYRRLLQGLDLPSPALYGIYRDPAKNRTGLVLEYLADSARVIKTSEPEAMDKAASWVGRFHTLCSTRLSSPALSFLRRYDPDYYKGWARRTLQMTEQSGLGSRWLETVSNRFDEVIEALYDSPPTIIHGEYYPENILLKDGMVYPVDWESTAVGSGEIDLVTLTEGWGQDAIQGLELEYQQARWPDGPPHDFQRSLCAARIYIQFRWLGDRPDWTRYQQQRLEVLRKHAKEMGLI